MTKRLTTLLATLVLGTTLLASGANAALPATGTASNAAIPADVAQIITEDGDRPAREGAHHRRFCLKLNAVLSRLVESGVITREQKLRILDAFNCVPEDRPSTDRPATTLPTALRAAAAR